MRAKSPAHEPSRRSLLCEVTSKVTARECTSIDPAGNLVLSVSHEGSESFEFQVSATCLQNASPYFSNLLHPSKFAEGVAVWERLNKLGNTTVGEICVDELPKVKISDLGRTSLVKNVKNLAADFLHIIHGRPLTDSPALAKLANLAVVADRFDAVPHLTRYVRRKGYIQAIERKTSAKQKTATAPEERIRQKLFVGLLLDHPPWVTLYSKRLVIQGSSRWRSEKEDDDSALWWDLPQRIEEELLCRREYILDTISSLQSYFLRLYTSGERQCKLGYDSSIQCDSFQLGELFRFFGRMGTLRLQSVIYDDPEQSAPPSYAGDIERLIESLRHCPSYQIDRNHTHCGLRTRLIPLLDLLQNHLDGGTLDVGVCMDCSQNHRADYAWCEAKRPLSWNRSMLSGMSGRRQSQGAVHENVCLARHIRIREMFMAVERDWTARDS